MYHKVMPVGVWANKGVSGPAIEGLDVGGFPPDGKTTLRKVAVWLESENGPVGGRPATGNPVP